MKRPARILPLAAALCASAWLASCRARSDRDLIAGVIDDMAARVEKKDARGLVAHLAGDYRDFEGRDRAQTEAMAEEYFGRYRGIVVKVLASRIAVRDPRSAGVETDVALYSGLAAALRKAVGFSGENYRVSWGFRKDRAWRVVEARWEYVPVEGLFPESLKVLRELFPGL